ncbi:hypothetical protein [Burkholderia cenocepacia]|uniref:Uncharacterized protein n=1 Tax=Burkholderia cenocepacia TaxID=95486 RepID=A0A1V2VWX7_9BURK|nr:hypothetical protein [Burkholderia cenocepacia]ONU48653.1 hypothetical protein A8E66_03485 [Burkholderia cenocepacia]ONU49964.1 hypothetical protein A8E67_38935 [Burkholderia cenocepacia]ONU51593.1 hypothetical protein A8E62_25505 [Burkholderia cenocepacia]ONU53319.1 hypothetical protein A8E68_36395 [Burkholderia cenocepacia]ONU77472.1 hypothetical protein A8E72_31915 [Burkholderia cenocepacia]
MGKLVETSQWEEDLYQIETADPVEGGPDGVSNKQAKQLGNRTRYLKAQVEQSQSGLAQHIAAADPHSQYATKSDLSARLAALVGQSPATLDTLKELADALGNDPNFATTVANQLGLKAPISSPVFTGAPKAPTQPQFDNTTLLATTGFVQGALGNFRNQIGLSAATTLLASAWGSAYTLFGGSSYNVTLPSLSSGVNGAAIRFSNIGSTSYTLIGAGSDTIFNGTTSNTLVLNPGDTVTLVSAGVWVMFGGSMSLLASGAMSGPGWRTQPQFDNSTRLATTAFVKQSGESYSSIQGIATTASLNSGHVGAFIWAYGAGSTLTLPPVAGVPNGATVTIGTPGGVTIKSNASETITNQYGSGSNTLALNAGEQVQFISNGGAWYLASYTTVLGTTPAAGDSSTKLATTAFVQQANCPVVGTARNVAMSITAASSSATLKADEVVVESALGGIGYRIANFNKSINLATTGAGGMDSGAAPASGYVAIYAIYNPSTGVSALLATNCTGSLAPEVYNAGSMPAGYGASALVSVWPTDSSGRLTVGFQRDRSVQITSTAAITTSSNATTQTQLSIAGVVPMNAKTISGVLHEASTATGSGVATITPGLGSVGGQNLSGALTASQVSECNYSIFLLTPQQVYYTTSVSAGTPTFIIYICAYTF